MINRENSSSLKKVFFAETPYVERPPELLSALRDKFELVGEAKSADFVLVYGGDGTMLRAIREYRHENNRFVGIHGGTVGFLMNENAAAVLDAGNFISTNCG